MEEKPKKNIEEEVEYVSDDDGALTKIEKLKKELEICRTEKDEYLGGWKRAKADFINAERDFIRREAENRKYVELRVMKDLVGIMDGFEHAFRGSSPDSEWSRGIQLIYENLKALLASYGVEKIDTKDKTFNPEFHEAIEVVRAANESEDDIIVDEFQTGYTIGERVLRPAKVKVSKFQSI